MLGRLFADHMFASPARLRRADFANPIVEAEVGFRMAQDLPPRDAEYSDGEVFDAIDTALITIEVPSPCFRDFRAVGPLSLIADNGVAHSIVVGPLIVAWQGLALHGFAIELLYDGAVVATELEGDARCDPMWVAHWTANRLRRDGGLKAGDIITTGAAATPLRLGDAREVVARFTGVDEARVTFD